MISTPVLANSQHPFLRECSELLNGVRNPARQVEDGEYYELFVRSREKVLWRSWERRLSLSFEARVNLRMRRSDRVNVLLVYTRYWRGFPYRVTVALPVRSRYLAKAQFRSFLLKFPDARYASAVANARRVASGKVQLAAKRVKSPRVAKTTRANPEIVNTPYLSMFEQINFGGHSFSATGRLRELSRRLWTGTTTPGYGKLKPSQLPVNPHSVTLRVEDVNGPLSEFQQVVSGPQLGDLSLLVDAHTLHYAAPAELVDHLPLARTKALRELIEMAESDIQANLAQDFAQIGMTMNLISNAANRIRGSLVNLKKGNLIQASKILFASKAPKFQRGWSPNVSKSLAQNWLAFQYGWKPLLQDIHGALEALSKLSLGNDFIRRVASSKTHRQDETTVLTNWHGIHAGEKSGFSRTITRSRCKFVLYYRTDSHLKAFMAQTGFTNPVNLAWEILPFSFVIDWFIPIGPYLETLSSWDGLTFLGGSETLFTKQEAISAIDYASTKFIAGNTRSYIHKSSYHRWTIKLDRKKLTTFPVQNFDPSVKNGLSSVVRAANAIALLKSVF